MDIFLKRSAVVALATLLSAMPFSVYATNEKSNLLEATQKSQVATHKNGKLTVEENKSKKSTWLSRLLKATLFSAPVIIGGCVLYTKFKPTLVAPIAESDDTDKLKIICKKADSSDKWSYDTWVFLQREVDNSWFTIENVAKGNFIAF